MCQWDILEWLLRLGVKTAWESFREGLLEEEMPKKNPEGSLRVAQYRRLEISGRKDSSWGAELKIRELSDS